MSGSEYEESPFGQGSDERLNACIGPHNSPYSYFEYAEGYFDSAELVCEKVMSDKEGVDSMIYPILYLYRHAVELSLKHFIKLKTGGHINTHELLSLWDQARLALIELFNSEGESKRILFALEPVVMKFNLIDPSSEIGRYPAAKDGAEHKSLSEMRIINIEPIYNEMKNFRFAVTMSLLDLSSRSITKRFPK